MMGLMTMTPMMLLLAGQPVMMALVIPHAWMMRLIKLKSTLMLLLVVWVLLWYVCEARVVRMLFSPLHGEKNNNNAKLRYPWPFVPPCRHPRFHGAMLMLKRDVVVAAVCKWKQYPSNVFSENVAWWRCTYDPHYQAIQCKRKGSLMVIWWCGSGYALLWMLVTWCCDQLVGRPAGSQLVLFGLLSKISPSPSMTGFLIFLTPNPFIEAVTSKNNRITGGTTRSKCTEAITAAMAAAAAIIGIIIAMKHHPFTSETGVKWFFVKVGYYLDFTLCIRLHGSTHTRTHGRDGEFEKVWIKSVYFF